jgi:hypothetical protein
MHLAASLRDPAAPGPFKRATLCSLFVTEGFRGVDSGGSS